MSVFILGAAQESCGWADVAASTVAFTDVPVKLVMTGGSEDVRDGDRFVLAADARNAPLALIGALSPATTIVLASSSVPLGLIEAVFTTPEGQGSRKIVDIAEAPEGQGAILALFEIADMLIFTPESIAAVLDLPELPKTVDDLLPVRRHMARYNQGVVVRFPGEGGAAVWADRILFVGLREPDGPEGTRARFSATIAAAVANKIGPAPALEMALAAAADIAPAD